MSHITNTKRSIGMVIGDFCALIGIMASMTGSQSLGGLLLGAGLCIYGVAAAVRWVIARISRAGPQNRF